MQMADGEFTVWGFLADGWHFAIQRHVDAKTAVEVAKRATLIPGQAVRIIIADAGDHTVFEWQRGKGVTYPPPHAQPVARGGMKCQES